VRAEVLIREAAGRRPADDDEAVAPPPGGIHCRRRWTGRSRRRQKPGSPAGSPSRYRWRMICRKPITHPRAAGIAATGPRPSHI